MEYVGPGIWLPTVPSLNGRSGLLRFNKQDRRTLQECTGGVILCPAMNSRVCTLLSSALGSVLTRIMKPGSQFVSDDRPHSLGSHDTYYR